MSNIGKFHSLDIDRLLDGIKEKYHQKEKQLEEMRQTLNEWRKDDEIQELKEANNFIMKHSLLQMTDKELAAEKAFREKHYKKCAEKYHSKAKGNTYIYELTGTGIGTIIKITCPLCGETKDITDEESW